MDRFIKTKYFLITVIFLSAILRIWKLGIIPPHLTPDEASLGYNAYSILKTAKDEYGSTLPIIFKSFGDYKPGLYIYLTVPSVALFGLNEFAARLPSALSGVLAVYLIYLVVFELYGHGFKRIGKQIGADKMASIASLLLAISPWHLHFSRGAWEANVSLTLTLAGIYFFLKSLKNSKFLVHASLFFSLTFLTYQGAKLSTVIVLTVLIICFWKHCLKLLKENNAVVIRATIAGLIIATPIIISFFQGRTGRLEVFSVFSYERPKVHLQAFLDQGAEKIGSLSYNLFHSEGVNFVRGIIGRWFNHFSGRFLFFEGDWQNPRHSAPNHGMLLLTDLILLIAGFIGVVRLKGKARLFILLWLVLAPLPAALSRDQVHAVRALNMVIPLTVISSVGLVNILRWIKSIKKPFLHYFYYLVFAAVMLVTVTYYLDSYFVHLPIHNAKYWFYGYKEAVQEVAQVQDNYKKIVFQQSYNQPYIFFLFHQQYDPASYQAQAELTETGVDVGLVEKFDNISFSSFSWPYPTDQKGTLVIADSVGIPHDFKEDDYKLISEIKYPDGFMTAFRIIEIK